MEIADIRYKILTGNSYVIIVIGYLLTNKVFFKAKI